MDVKVHVIDYGRTNLVLQYVDPVTGKRKTKSSRTSDRDKAIIAAIEWQTELRNGIYKEPARLSWDEFRERYENEYLFTELKESSVTRVMSSFNYIERVMSPKRLNQITSQWVTQFKKRASEGRSVDTVNVDLRNLKAALNWAKSQKMIAEVPAIRQIKKPKGARSMKGRPIATEEFERMLAAVPKCSAIGRDWAPAWQRFMQGLWWSGLRLSEAANLTWDEYADGFRVRIDSEGLVFLLISAQDEKGGKDRLYPVAPEFAEMLRSVPEERRKGLVFDLPQKGNQRPASTEIGRKISAVGKLAKVKVSETGSSVKYASAHDLRRAFGVRWSRRLMPAELMELMRHENIETTMKFYVDQQAEVTARKLQEAFDRHNTLHNTAELGTASPTTGPDTNLGKSSNSAGKKTTGGGTRTRTGC